MTQHFEFTPYAGWNQVHLKDETSTDDLSMQWTPEAVARELAIGDRVLGIGTYRDTNVPFEVDVFEKPPDPVGGESWDRINDVTIDVQSGALVLWGCGEYWPTSPRISVKPGSYAVRIFYGGKDTLSEDGVDGADHYRIWIWPNV
ncbi:MAG TPA: hypothetical protein VEV38_11975 [Candidatus Eremiobacteraceae bacterium]|nr:hypothetical protein [Candidatus Eremiobacteraceae bacterium]